MKPATCLILALTCIACGAGCASGPSIKTWQRSVEKYVQENKNDPNVLRDVTLAGNRRGFGVIGALDPRHSTDARGVLLGHKTVAGRPWFVYLVGLVDSEKVEEIRLAAVSFNNGRAEWRVGGQDKQPFSRYVNYNRDLWRNRYGKKSKIPAEYLGFPREADRFNLAVADRQLDATHEGSGARWRLTLP